MRSRLFAALSGLAGLALAPPLAAHASPSPAESVQLCAFDDYEQRRDHPGPAAKPLADLNVGNPRTVRMIYFLPNDWSYRAEVVESMKTVIRQSQTFYREQMQAHGYGGWTFGIETDAQGEPLVHRVDGRLPFSHYDNTLGWAVIEELQQTFDLDANIYFIVLGTDALRQSNGQPAGGVGRRRTKNGGYLVVPDRFEFFTVTHELGHAFGLYHDFRDNRYIMSYGHEQRPVLSACAAEFLAAHVYFNPAVPVSQGMPPTVEILSNTRYQPGTTSVPVQLRVRDSEELHQAMLIGHAKPCRGLAGRREAVVEFDYDGSFWAGGFSTLPDLSRHHLHIVAVDTEGNVSETTSLLAEVSPYEIATIEGYLDIITSVAFSPDGAVLVYGSKAEAHSRDATVVLWDLQTRESTPVLDTEWVTYVAFSRSGTLAAGFLDGVKLVDVGTRREIASLRGGYGNVAFSRDGTLLATLGGGLAIKLWEVRTRNLLATLEGHTDQINAVAFSPDGALLASGSGNGELGDDAVRLWDVASQKEIATMAVPGFGVWSLAFSPDGTILAWGSALGGATLWDVARREEIALAEKGGPPVAFSPDGATLFFGSGSGEITLWDVGSREEIVTLAGVSQDVNSISVSPDGTMVAAGSWWSGTITLWDVSEWTGPRPFALEIVAGDGQPGAPGAALPHPLVVEVRDQNGSPLPETTVNFAVTAGGGRLSATTATTGSDGRASITLTLGPTPGRNLVRAIVAGLEPVVFGATGLAVPRMLDKLSGDEQQAAVGARLTEPLVALVRDQNGAALPGVVVTFAVPGDGGSLSAAVDTTDAEGRASTTLTLGGEVGTYTVEATVAGLPTVTFTATAKATPDFDGDGVIDLSDFFLFAEAFGSSDPRFDLDGSGRVDFTDFFLFAESFGQPARARLAAMARERIGLPDGPQLRQNAPNPFNTGTVIAWFQLQPGPARLEVFALTGQRVAVLHQGAKKAGIHRLRWDGRDEQGRPLASGVYVYRLVTAGSVQTRKLTLLR